jgi:hypothetical protein
MTEQRATENATALKEYRVHRKEIWTCYSNTTVFAASESDALKQAAENECNLNWTVELGLEPEGAEITDAEMIEEEDVV